ncbi:MAG: PorT family protein [Bacteroidales bacterium]|nr:PorT family protein [Bacteroidales bacterium]
MRIILINFVLWLIIFPSYGQNNVKIRTIELGLGINHLTKNSEADPKIGFGLAVKKIWFSEKKINLISGLNFEKIKYFDDYIQCGQYCNYKDMKFNIYTFSIPFMLRVNMGNTYKVIIEAGPTFEIIPLKYGKGIEVTYPPASSTTETDISGDFEHDFTDFGANIGLGFLFPVNNLKIIISSTYHNSITSLIQMQHDELAEYLSIKLGFLINY